MLFLETEIQRNVRLRLVSDSSYKSIGRVEVLYNGIWGTICSDSFSFNDATVICRQLGFIRAFTYNTQSGNDTRPIWLDDLNCSGRESSITLCQHSGWGVHNCDHHQDISVTCYDSM